MNLLPAKYKRAYFVDWRVADRIKQRLFDRVDYYSIPTNLSAPKMITGGAFRRGLRCALDRPLRVVPFFDPGPWGGQWMREVCDLPDGPPNYAWCFDCVPEENSLLLNMAGVNIETPGDGFSAVPSPRTTRRCSLCQVWCGVSDSL